LGARDVDFASAEEASLFLIQSAHISTVPWDDAGRFVRFSATFEADTLAEEEEVLAEVGKRISTLGLRF
jgi:LL-diaminopimelate aminotransferase